MSARKGFTLIELLVVMVILAILVALVVGVFSGAQARGRQAGCSSNLAQIAKAHVNYSNDNNDNLPHYTGAPNETWILRVANYMGVANTGTQPEPSLLDCSKSKAFLSPMALHHAKRNSLKIATGRQISYGTNYSLNTPTSSAVVPRRMSEFEYPTQTMLAALTPREEASQGWKLRADAADYNTSASAVYQQTGTKEQGVTVAWMDGRAQYLKFAEVPTSSGQTLPNWRDSGGKEYAYSYGMFWQGLPVYDSTRWP
jgi:prepilin-type N-terminal cleavage/methylation domain-containing protein